MRSLFLKIFLSFWLAQALFLVLAILVTVALRPAREISAVEASQSRFLSEAVAAYQAGGAEKVRDYLHNLGETQHVHSVLFNEQGPVTGRSTRPWFT
jgi:two-component system sensor histidine kinase CpxA